MTRESNQIKELKKENDDLKLKINYLQAELQKISKKLDKSPNLGDGDELRNSISFVSDEYDNLKTALSQMKEDLMRIDHNLSSISKKVFDIEESIETMMEYSYQYNLKIVGIPEGKDAESAEESVQICLNLFNEMGANIKDHDIDIAHRLQRRNTSPSSAPAAIVCKFTRRLAKEAVMKCRKEIYNVDLSNVVSMDIQDPENYRPSIFDHLTPRKQDLLKQSKAFQKEYGYQYCWVKNREILLRENPEARIHKIRSAVDLEKLRVGGAGSFGFPPHTSGVGSFGLPL